MCGDCVTSIHSNKGFAKHQVVDLSKKASVMGPPLCEVHKGRPKDLYCLDCKVSTCELVSDRKRNVELVASFCSPVEGARTVCIHAPQWIYPGVVVCGAFLIDVS